MLAATATATAALHLDAASEARARLTGLADLAGTIDLSDVAAWAGVAAEARPVLRSLAEATLIPPHLVVQEGEPAVVTQRTIAAARRHLAR
jgi:hypothetical protein